MISEHKDAESSIETKKQAARTVPGWSQEDQTYYVLVQHCNVVHDDIHRLQEFVNARADSALRRAGIVPDSEDAEQKSVVWARITIERATRLVCIRLG